MDVNLDGNTITNAYLSGIEGSGTINLADATVTLPPDSVTISNIDATGTPSSTSYLRGDGTWSNPTSGGAPVTLTGDAVGTGTGTVPVTVEGLNGTSLAGLASGVLYNTTATGVPSIATANQLASGLTGTTGTVDLSGATLKIPQGTAATLAGLTPASGEPYWATDTKELFLGDGTTVGANRVVKVNSKNIYVSQSTGTDTRATGVSKYDPNIPFATLTGALAAASSGDTIWALDGTFTDTGMQLKDGVCFYFAPSANLNTTGTVWSTSAATATLNGIIIAGCGQTLTSTGSILSNASSGSTYGANILFNNVNLSSTGPAITGGSLPVTTTVNGNVTGTGSLGAIGGSSGIASFIVVNGIVSNSSGPAYVSGGGSLIANDISETTPSTAGFAMTLRMPQVVVQNLVSPSTGFSQAFSYGPRDQNMVITPASTLATGTVTFPSDTNTRIGQKMWISNASAYTITSLTVSVSGGTIYGYTTGALPPGSIMFQKTAANVWQQIAPNSGAAGGVSSISNSDGTLTVSPTTGSAVASLNLGHANTWTADQTFSANAALSAPSVVFSGSWVTSGGTGTTTTPTVLIQPAGTTGSSNWATTGTGLGINAPSGFTGNIIDCHIAGGTGFPFNVTWQGRVAAQLSYQINNSQGQYIMQANWILAGAATAGVMMFTNSAGTGAPTRMVFGLDTSSYVGLAPNGTTMQVVLGGGTTLAPLNASTLIVGGGTSAVTLSSGASSAQTLTLPNATGTVALTDSGNITTITGTSQAAATNQIYITNNASLVTVTLPSTANVGDTVEINGLGGGGWKLAQNASQVMHMSSTSTTTGTGGSIASTNQYNTIKVRCIVASTTWIVIQSQGTLTVT